MSYHSGAKSIFTFPQPSRRRCKRWSQKNRGSSWLISPVSLTSIAPDWRRSSTACSASRNTAANSLSPDCSKPSVPSSKSPNSIKFSAFSPMWKLHCRGSTKRPERCRASQPQPSILEVFTQRKPPGNFIESIDVRVGELVEMFADLRQSLGHLKACSTFPALEPQGASCIPGKMAAQNSLPAFNAALLVVARPIQYQFGYDGDSCRLETPSRCRGVD